MEHQHAKPRADDRFTAYPQFLYREVKAKQEQLFEKDPELAQLLDNVAAVLSEHAVVLADDIADMECDIW
ncbi:hypothetical protein V7799_20655 [Rhizobium laguerreae]